MPPKITQKKQAFNPLILRCHRLMEAFAKSDDERDFILDRMEGFIVYVDLDKPETELDQLYTEVTTNPDRYILLPKLTFYETKKIMEGFVNEKVYDIDTKEKLLEIIQSKEARENFLEFIYDHHSEMEKWQQYYHERFRIRIIEWLRVHGFEFVFEEDLDLPKDQIEKLKANLFEPKVGKEIESARKALILKAKTYYSNEALNPRPKRGRPPKQQQKTEVEPQITMDIFTTVPPQVRPFLFTPDYQSSHALTFSTRFETEDQMMARKKKTGDSDYQLSVESLNAKLNELRSLSSKWLKENPHSDVTLDDEVTEGFDLGDEEDEDEEPKPKKKAAPAKAAPKTPPKKKK